MGFIEVWIQRPPTAQLDENDLQRFIAGKIEENLNLEYKSIDLLRKPEKLSREISAFANSEGGLLVVGIKEDANARRLPGEIEWDREDKHTREWFQDVAVNNIRPLIQGVRIHAIRSTDGAGKIFLVDVPASDNPPHMSNGKYYFRNNFETLPMEHYQIADLFGKRRRPILTPSLTVDSYDSTAARLGISYKIGNTGHALAKWPMVFMVLRFCTVTNSEDKSLWESRRKVVIENGVETWNVSHSSPIHVLHQWMESTLGKVDIQLAEFPAIVSISVGAEDMPTERYLTILSRRWLHNSVEEGKVDGRRVELPLVSQTGIFDEFQHDRWLNTVGEAVCEDLEKTQVERRKYYFNQAFRTIGMEAVLLLAKAIEKYPAMADDFAKEMSVALREVTDTAEGHKKPDVDH